MTEEKEHTPFEVIDVDDEPEERSRSGSVGVETRQERQITPDEPGEQLNP